MSGSAPAPPPFLESPEPPTPFVGREADVTRLTELLKARPFLHAFEPVVITGEPGIGKTAFAAAFCHRRSRRERSIWIPCRDWKPYVQPFERLMRDRFIDRPRDTLAVLDGADDIERNEFLDLFHRIANFKVVRTILITSRKVLELRGEHVLRLERLSKEASQDLMQRILSLDDLGADDVASLTRSIHGHPLAASLIAGMARTLSREQLRQVLAGHLYDLNDVSPKQQRELVAAAKPLVISANEAMVLALKRRPNDVFRLTPREFEELIAELLHGMGYRVELTPATRDGGKDILASLETACGDVLCLVEAKKHRADRKIGVSMVRTLYGTLADFGASSAMLVTTSTYSQDAHAMQQRHRYQLSLRDYTDVASWIQRYGAKTT